MGNTTTEPAHFRRLRTAALAVFALAVCSFGSPPNANSEDVTALEQIASFDGRGDVMRLRWSPRGNLLAIASSDPAVRLRTIPGGSLAATLRGHGSHVYDVDWNEDGSLLASAACDSRDSTAMHCMTGGVIVWDVKSQNLVHQLSFPHHTHPVATRMEQKEGKASAVDPHSQPGAEVRAVAWSKDGRSLAVGNAAGVFRVWDTSTWKVIHEATPHWQITDMAWSPDGRLAVAARDNTITIWDRSGTRLTRVLKQHSLDVYAVDWHSTLPLLASAGGDRTVVIWDAHNDERIRTLTEFGGSVRCVAWHPDGRHLAVTAYTPARGVAEILVYDTQNWRAVARAVGDDDSSFRSLAWSPDGSVLASGGNDYVIKLWRFAVRPISERDRL